MINIIYADYHIGLPYLGKALLLKFFQKERRFPEDVTELPSEIVAYVAQQLDLPPEVIHNSLHLLNRWL